jgi:hypothetical protein
MRNFTQKNLAAVMSSSSSSFSIGFRNSSNLSIRRQRRCRYVTQGEGKRVYENNTKTETLRHHHIHRLSGKDQTKRWQAVLVP